MNVHLDHRSENSREKTIELILRKLIAEADPMPIFVVRDFNVRPTNPIIKRMESSLPIHLKVTFLPLVLTMIIMEEAIARDMIISFI